MSGRTWEARAGSWRGSGITARLRILAVGGVVVLVAGPLAGQDVSLGQLEEQHRTAVREYQLAVDVAATQRRLWEERVTAYYRARSDGSEGDNEVAYQELEAAHRELMRLEARIGELRARVDDTRRALLVALEDRLQTLETRFASTNDPVESRRVRNRILADSAQYRRLQDEVIAPDPATILYAPSVTVDPRDGPPQLRFKVDWLERRVAEADSAIVRTDRELERLRTLQRVEQASGDFRAGLDRFGDTRLLTGQSRPTGAREGEIPADSAAVRDARPLDQQIEEALALRERLMEFREATVKRAEEFRVRLRRITE